MKIPLKDAITQLKNELRQAMQEADPQDLIFSPAEIELELVMGWEHSGEVEGSGKFLALLDVSAEASTNHSRQHMVRIKLNVSKGDKPIHISDASPRKL